MYRTCCIPPCAYGLHTCPLLFSESLGAQILNTFPGAPGLYFDDISCISVIEHTHTHAPVGLTSHPYRHAHRCACRHADSIPVQQLVASLHAPYPHPLSKRRGEQLAPKGLPNTIAYHCPSSPSYHQSSPNTDYHCPSTPNYQHPTPKLSS